MKLTVAFPFAVPTRTLAVLVLGASLGGPLRVAHSQIAPPEENPALAPDLGDNVDATAGATADADAIAGDTNRTAKMNGAYDVTPGRGEGAGRAQSRRTALERVMRNMMATNGITTTSTQDAILTFLRDEEEGKRAVRDASRKLWNGVRRDAPAERLRSLLTDYQKALDNARDERQRAQTALDARVGYSLNARLESLLWLLGVLGEGQNQLTLPQAVPAPRGPRIANNNATVPFPNFGTALIANPLQIEGVVNAKNRPGETMTWLEIRDANGRLWRMVPSNNPDAQPILIRQIGGLVVGARVLVRLVSPPIATLSTPYSLLALATTAEAGGNDNEYGGGDGATDAPDGQ